MQGDLLTLSRNSAPSRFGTLGSLGDLWSDIQSGIEGIGAEIQGGMQGAKVSPSQSGIDTNLITGSIDGSQQIAEVKAGETYALSGNVTMTPNWAQTIIGLDVNVISHGVAAYALQSRIAKDLGLYFDNVSVNVSSGSGDLYYVTAQGRLRSDYAFASDAASVFRAVIESGGLTLNNPAFQRTGNAGNAVIPLTPGVAPQGPQSLSNQVASWFQGLTSSAAKGAGAGLTSGALATVTLLAGATIAGIVVVKVAAGGKRR